MRNKDSERVFSQPICGWNREATAELSYREIYCGATTDQEYGRTPLKFPSAMADR